MIPPTLLKALQATPNEALREIIAHAAGIHAWNDRDGGRAIATALRRVADRIEGMPRRSA